MRGTKAAMRASPAARVAVQSVILIYPVLFKGQMARPGDMSTSA
jgi:hypothetical protein